MPDKCDMRWFKQTFHEQIDAALQDSPFTLDFMTALACQETGEVWPILRKSDLSLDRILELCVGDTLDAPNRSAFPKNKAALVAVANPDGQAMFDLAHQLLVEMAQFVDSYKQVAKQANKFCHGYGIFQFDLQFFEDDPEYFLERQFANFDQCLAKAIGELNSAQNKIPTLRNKTELTDREMAFVAIAYNTGHFNPAKGLKQGFRPPGGLFYGEQIFDFNNQAKAVPLEDETESLPFTVNANGPLFKVKSTQLNLRSEPCLDSGPASNIIARLSQGDEVQAMTNQKVRGFLEVETKVGNERMRGFAFFNLLQPA